MPKSGYFWVLGTATSVLKDGPSMTTVELLATLHAHGVTLSARGDRLSLDVPEGTLTPALRADLRTNQVELLAVLEAFEKRAAIAEYDSGLPRGEAERLACACVLGEVAL